MVTTEGSLNIILMKFQFLNENVLKTSKHVARVGLTWNCDAADVISSINLINFIDVTDKTMISTILFHYDYKGIEIISEPMFFHSSTSVVCVMLRMNLLF